MSRRFLVLWLLAPLIANQVDGQEANSNTRIGLGVGWNSSDQMIIAEDGGFSGVTLIGIGNFSVPILIGGHVRIEPEFGILRTSEDQQDEGYSWESSQTLWRVGVAGHWAFSTREGLQPYFGPRFGLIRYSGRMESRSDGQQDEYKRSRRDWYLGLALGGEYFISRHFSIGAEVQLNYLMIGDESFEPDPGPSSAESSSSLFMNNGLIAARFYF